MIKTSWQKTLNNICIFPYLQWYLERLEPLREPVHARKQFLRFLIKLVLFRNNFTNRFPNQIHMLYTAQI